MTGRYQTNCLRIVVPFLSLSFAFSHTHNLSTQLGWKSGSKPPTLFNQNEDHIEQKEGKKKRITKYQKYQCKYPPQPQLHLINM